MQWLHARGRRSRTGRKNYFFFSALALGLGLGFFVAGGAAAFASPLAGALRPSPGPFAGRRGPSVAFFLLFLGHFDVAGAPGRLRGGDFFLSARGAATAMTGMCLSPKISTPAGGTMSPRWMDLPISSWLTSTMICSGKSFGRAADLELVQNVFEHAAAGLHAGGFAGGFHRHLNGDLFVFGDFVEIHVQHLAVERVMLDFLHEREALGAGVVFDGQIHQQVFRDGVMQQVGKFLRS